MQSHIIRWNLLLAVSASLLASCAEEKKFAGGPPTAAVKADDAIPQAPNPAPIPAPAPVTIVEETNSCEPSNLLRDHFPKEISDCYESGRVWNFDSKACVQMRKATFACDWGTVVSELEKINLPNATVSKAAAAPKTSVLIGCGQSEDKMRIVVQWVNVPEGNGCKNVAPGNTVTGCFTNYGTKTPPAPAANDEERAKRTYACMNQL